MICMHASNIHLFLATQKQSTQVCQSTAVCWEILSIKAKLSFLSRTPFLFFGCVMVKGTGRKTTVLCVHWLAAPAITVRPGFLSSNSPEVNT